eukprot:CAMPEP_0116575184 /NCGR_PEP_ID=MMETSP0397-20121206/19816_1 /TAXON_ID=216820 /ORGANISM="Cyclophora tenuis, Strain ECT3854" /LENGTH=389 /DNA_ID=CAMNT_0004104047 /DNA_START=39 /DNA_END=1208 /DNA_ORIENTATION=-
MTKQAVEADLLDFDAPPVMAPARAAAPPIKTRTSPPAPQMDLLDFGSGPTTTAAPAPTATLDIFSATPTRSTFPSTTGNLLEPFPTNDGGVNPNDLLEPFPSRDNDKTSLNSATDLLSMMTVTSSSSTTPAASAQENVLNGLDGLGGSSTAAAPSQKMSIMSSNVDRFAALDELAPPEAAKAGSILSGLEAENRILSFSSSSATSANQNGLSSLSPGDNVSSMPMSGSMMDSTLPDELGSGMQSLDPSSLPGGRPSAMMGGDSSLTMGGISSLVMGGEANVMGGDPSLMGGASLSSSNVYGDAPYMGEAPPVEMPSMPPPMPPEELPPMPPDDPPSIPGVTLPTMDRYVGNMEGGEDNGFLMGGSTGAGLGDPIVDMPSAPPPPPPDTQ